MSHARFTSSNDSKSFDLAIVLPMHNEEEGIANAIATIAKHIPSDLTYQFVCVDDGSRDRTWQTLQELVASQKWPIAALKFNRNFGKEAAIFAGLAEVNARAAVIMDSDLQHPPEIIPRFIDVWKTGTVKVVDGIKQSRGEESSLKSWAVKTYYGFLRNLTNLDLQTSSDFKLLDKEVVDHLLTLREVHTFFRANVVWFGFPTAQIPFSVAARERGTSSWSFKKNVELAVFGVISFSSAPLRLTSFLSFIFFCLSIIIGSIVAWDKISGRAVEGFTTVILLQLIIGCLLFFNLGIIGRYLAVISDNQRGRPRYCVSETARS